MLIAWLLSRNPHLERHEDGASLGPSIKLAVLQWAPNDSWFGLAHELWKNDVDLEACCSMPPCGVRISAE